MGYAKEYNPESYGNLLPILEKALKLGPGGKMSFRVTDGNINTIAYTCRQFFRLNPHVPNRAFTVRAGTQVEHLEEDVIEIEKKPGVAYTIEEIE